MRWCNAMTIPADLNKFLHALANDNRQRIMLLFAETHVMTVSVVAERTNLGMSTVSEHLKQLKEAGLLRSEKFGKEVEYRPNVEQIQATLDVLGQFLKKCC